MARKRYGRRGFVRRHSVGIVSAVGVGAGLAKIFLTPAPAYSGGKSVVGDLMAGAKDPNTVNKVISHMTDWKTWVLMVGVPIGSKVASKFAGRIPIARNVHVLG